MKVPLHPSLYLESPCGLQFIPPDFFLLINTHTHTLTHTHTHSGWCYIYRFAICFFHKILVIFSNLPHSFWRWHFFLYMVLPCYLLNKPHMQWISVVVPNFCCESRAARNMNWHLSLFAFAIISLGKKQVVEVKLVALRICALKTLTHEAKLLWRKPMLVYSPPSGGGCGFPVSWDGVQGSLFHVLILHSWPKIGPW